MCGKKTILENKMNIIMASQSCRFLQANFNFIIYNVMKITCNIIIYKVHQSKVSWVNEQNLNLFNVARLYLHQDIISEILKVTKCYFFYLTRLCRVQLYPSYRFEWRVNPEWEKSLRQCWLMKTIKFRKK